MPSERALVIGAGGFLGRAIVHELRSAGFDVRGLVRPGRPTDRVEVAGGLPVLGDILDLRSLERAASGCAALVHVAAAAEPIVPDPGYPERVRVEGARNAVRAARKVGATKVVIGSGYWVYADQRGTIDASSPLDPRGESRINRAAEQAAIEEARDEGPAVIVARPGMVYGDGAWFRPLAASVRDGSYRLIDGGTNPWSFVSLRDTGRAFATLLAHGPPSGVYNVVDGRPAPWAEFVRFVADRLGRPMPPSVDRAAAVEAYGPDIAHHLTARRAVSNTELRSLGWSPLDPDYREGVARLLTGMEFPTEPGS